jgi:hypothetical protein
MKAHKYILAVVWICLIASMFIGQASGATSTDFQLDEDKITTYYPTTTQYGTYEVYERSWWDLLGIWTTTKKAEVTLDYNLDNCVNCRAEGRTTLLEPRVLFDDLDVYTKNIFGFYNNEKPVNDLKVWVKSSEFYPVHTIEYTDYECSGEGEFELCNPFTNSREAVMQEVDNYERVCVPDEYYTDELVEVERLSVNGTLEWVNETQPVLQTRYLCEQVLNGTKLVELPEWIEYDYSVLNGTYNWRITGTKKADADVDWVGTVFGAQLKNWAVWGPVENFSIYPVAQYRLNSQNFSLNNQTQVLDTLGLNNGTLIGKTFNNGNVSGGVTIDDGAMKFDGVDGYVEGSASGSLNFTTENFSVSVWINTADVNQLQAITGKKADMGGQSDAGYYFYIESNTARFVVSDGVNRIRRRTVVGAFNSNEWVYLTAVYTGNNIITYVNGVSSNQGIETTGTLVNPINNAIPFRIGSDRGDRRFMNGSLDDVGIWERALSQDEITQLYNQGRGSYSSVTNGLVAQYSGRDFAGTSASPTTIYDTNHLTEGKVNQGLSFDGVDDYISLSATTALFSEIALTSSFSFNFWVYPSNGAGTLAIFSQTRASGDRFQVAVIGNTLAVNYYNGSNRAISGTITQDTWQYVSYQYSNGVYSLYLNGVAQTGTTNTAPSGVVATIIGSRTSTADYFFNGSLDDVRVFNYSLSEIEVQALYNDFQGTEAINSGWAVLNSPVDNAVNLGNPVELSSSAEIIGAELVNVSFFYRVNGGSWSEVVESASGTTDTVTTELTFNAGDIVDWYSRWQDSDGDYGNSTEIRTFTMDDTNPVVDITTPIDQTYYTKSINLTIDATDSNLQSIWYSLNGGANTTYTESVLINAQEHSNTLDVWANDSVGLLGYDSVTFNVQTINVTLNSPADASTVYTNLVTFNSSVISVDNLANASLYTSVNGGAWEVRNTTNTTYITENVATNAHNNEMIIIQSNNNRLQGVRFSPKTNRYLFNVTKDSTSNPTACSLYWVNQTLIKNGTFVGNNCDLGIQLVANGNYWLMAHSNGAVFQGYRTNQAGGILPISSSQIFWNATSDDSGAFNDRTNIIQIFTEITTGSYTTTTNLSTQTFNNTYSAGDVVEWNTLSCNMGGDCRFADANYTFSVDAGLPQLALNYPTPLIDYGRLNGTLQLSITATDDNLDSVWYNYNGTNVSLTGAVSGVANLSNITLSTKKNVTICALDQAGNQNCEVFGWDSKVFENSRTLNESSFETALEGYSINVTANSSLTGVSLLYNSTSYPMTQSGSVWSYSRDLPSSVLGNNSVQFRFTYQEDSINSDTSYQNVSSISWNYCTSGTPYLNITVKDEATLSNIDSTVPLADFEYYLGSGTETKTYQYINTSENLSSHAFCFSPITRTVKVDSRIQYSATSYPQRVWNPDVISYTNSTTNQVLYLLSSADGIYVTLQVINTADQVLSGVEITVEREISGSDVVVGQGTTGLDGTVTFWLNPDFMHDFTFTKLGFETFETSFQPTQSSYTITLGGGAVVPSNYFKGMTYSINPTNQSLTNDTTYNFGFLLSSSFWDLDEYGFNLRLVNGTIISGSTTTISGTQLTKSYNTGDLNRIYIDYYWVVDGVYTNGSKYWNVYNTDKTQWSIKTWFSDLNSYMSVGIFGLDDFGRYLIVFIIIFLTVGILSYKYGITSPISITTTIFLTIFFFEVVVNLIPPIRGIDNLLTYLSGLILVLVIFKEMQQ